MGGKGRDGREGKRGRKERKDKWINRGIVRGTKYKKVSVLPIRIA